MLEAQLTGQGTGVAVQGGRVDPTGKVQIGPGIGVTVEHRHPAADEEGEFPVVDMIDTGDRRLLDEARGRSGGPGEIGSEDGPGTEGEDAGCQGATQKPAA